jgi:hypothetical protein
MIPIKFEDVSSGISFQRLLIRPSSFLFIALPVVVSFRPGGKPVVEHLDVSQLTPKLLR